MASFSARISDVVSVPWRATVMSAPILVSRNGERDCLTDTAEVPFAFSFDDHEVSELIARFAAGRVFGEGPSRAEASALSWLQSSLLTSISFMMSASLASGAASAAVSSGSLFQGEVCGDTCAAADTTAARLKPATSIGSLARPNRIVKVIAQPAFQNRKGAFPCCKIMASHANIICKRIRHGRDVWREDALRAFARA